MLMEEETRHNAARVIQRAWRKHIDVQVYRYYRDLISFKNQGDPSVILKCVNPNEAKLLDQASGTFVRFRLAGDKFPPNIYYKVFTRSPIVDMCANSPKNYSKASAHKLPAREHNNRCDYQNTDQSSKTDWYRRFENNGWRLVADRLIHSAAADPTTKETSKKFYHMTPNGLMREEDVKRRRKQKKIEWLRQLYNRNMLTSKVNQDKEKEAMVMETAEGMINALNGSSPADLYSRTHGTGSGTHAPATAGLTHENPIDSIEEWEVDELLSWTNALNFDDYLLNWREVGTTSTKQDAIDAEPEIVRLEDPCEFTIRRENRLQDAIPEPLSHHFIASSRPIKSFTNVSS